MRTEKIWVWIEVHIFRKDVVDIISNAPGTAGRLSNFTERRFVFDSVPCHSIEGVLQSFKCPDTARQKELCLLYGKEAKLAGQEYDWTGKQLLYWNGTEYPRKSEGYQRLLDRLYDAVYEQDAQFRADLRSVRNKTLDHTIGAFYRHRSVLTRREFIAQLCRLKQRTDNN